MAESGTTTTFLTGATGFLGQYVLRDLLLGGVRVVTLLRPPLDDSLQRVSRALSRLGIDLQALRATGQFVPVEGALPGLIPNPTWGRTDQVVHTAASLQLFANGNGEPLRTNVDGMEALLEWAEQNGVSRVMGVSTAYVCGWNGGDIDEVLHSPRPEFQTDYELSKWLAEHRLADWGKRTGGTVTILRPSFLVGDSETGYSTQFQGFYQLAKLVYVLKERHCESPNGKMTRVPLRIPAVPDDVHDLVPVDFAARIVTHVAMHPEFHGRIFHLTNPNPPTSELLKGHFERYFHLDGGVFVDPTTFNGDRSEDEAFMWSGVIEPRISFSPRFRQDNTSAVLEHARLQFPQLDDSRFTKMLDFAVQSRWGKLQRRESGAI